MTNWIMTTNNLVLYIQSNSPGEITAWIPPIIREFKGQFPSGIVTLLLTPCQYASGEEMAVSSAIPGIDHILTPKQTLQLLFKYPFVRPHTNSAIICLGGDPVYSRLFAFKYKLKSAIYTHRSITTHHGFDYCFSRRIHGDLMLEHFRSISTSQWTRPINEDYCLFLCGSRPQHFFNLLPIIQRTVRIIKKSRPNFQAVLLVSPFINSDRFNQFSSTHDLSDFIIVRDSNQSLYISFARLVVTIPGTNTLQIGALNTPAIVLVPLNNPKALIFDGLAGLIGKIPIICHIFLFFMAHSLAFFNRRTGFLYSLPNQILNQSVFTEIVGILRPKSLAKAILNRFTDTAYLNNARTALADIDSPPIASTMINQLFRSST